MHPVSCTNTAHDVIDLVNRMELFFKRKKMFLKKKVSLELPINFRT